MYISNFAYLKQIFINFLNINFIKTIKINIEKRFKWFSTLISALNFDSWKDSINVGYMYMYMYMSEFE